MGVYAQTPRHPPQTGTICSLGPGTPTWLESLVSVRISTPSSTVSPDACHAEGRGFESHHPLSGNPRKSRGFLLLGTPRGSREGPRVPPAGTKSVSFVHALEGSRAVWIAQIASGWGAMLRCRGEQAARQDDRPERRAGPSERRPRARGAGGVLRGQDLALGWDRGVTWSAKVLAEQVVTASSSRPVASDAVNSITVDGKQP